ncbi:1-pyrroline-5-carboxylate dehydrogenase [Pseudoclavibacter sp. RFBJ3]|uniref:proline dehydrogenase family protein n=1 Tax=unclassified Pseudoclavibacter TaxID=2615177 RepID=UPI000CE89296|nr:MULTISPECIES: proline dehydrogenase family protein [unclassified Pseudoclavibacter]PPF81721.1 1-pyrroline-5-carboxylate dehydrogenase [Pseudoclavibacter sp. RFBJ5]PPF91051.1 1-pyrroline-5-carboxylate dehydrogenase [Pseudoclavibacter sp. RFBJ3]PPG00327.1 1-pyrroline-5-carboxylate dehydrogenase [Pseudoclavibacter sp. RFBH5]PPG19342.1 1-pyrroline-5-carboxylate dehydrogenase [Pseudoclavibacter sp. RFBI4]
MRIPSDPSEESRHDGATSPNTGANEYGTGANDRGDGDRRARGLEEVDARRVQRADFVKQVLAKRDGGADADPESSVSASSESALPGAGSPAGQLSPDETVTVDDSIVRALRAEGRTASSDRDAASDGADGVGAAGTAGPADAAGPVAERTVAVDDSIVAALRAEGRTATGDRDASDASRAAARTAGPAAPGTPPTSAEPAAPARKAPVDAAPPTAAMPVVTQLRDVPVSEALPAALATLRGWRDQLAASDAQRAAAVEAASSARARRRADTTSELDRVLSGPDGADFLRSLIDDVIRPDDAIAAGNGLGDLAPKLPASLSPGTKRAFQLGAFAGPGVPWLAVPLMRRATSAFFGDDTVRNVPAEISAATERAASRGAVPRIRLLGDAVLGERGSNASLETYTQLLAAGQVRELELRVPDIEAQPALWDFDGTLERVVFKLAALGRAALTAPTPPLIMLRTQSSADLELTVQAFMRAFEQEELRGLHVGISLPAQFPETTGLLRRIGGWAHMRREDLGSDITVAITRDANHELERADAVINGWRLATYASEADVDANFARLLDEALAIDHAAAFRVEVEADARRDVALAAAIAKARGLPRPVRVVVPRSSDEATLGRIRSAGVEVVERTPVITGSTQRHAASYLQHRVDVRARQLGADPAEGAPAATAGLPADAVHPDDERLLSATARMRQIDSGPNREQDRVLADDAATVTASIQLELFPEGLFEDEEPAAERPARVKKLKPASKPVIDDEEEVTENPADTGPSPRLTEVVLGLKRGRLLRNTFRNAPGTDPSLASNREWLLSIQRRVPRSELGIDEVERHLLHEPGDVDALLSRAERAAEPWAQKPGWERAAVLEKVAKALEANRARLIEVAVSETGTPLPDVDADVSRCVDLANYYAHLARQLDRMQGADFEPVAVTVVTPSWVPAVAGSAGHTAQALAAGSAVVLKPSPRTRRTAAVFAEVLWDADIPRDLVQLAICDESLLSDEQLGQMLITDDRVQRVLLSGNWETARSFLRWRPDLPLIAATSGKNSMIITPSADLDRAALDVARSAFLSAGQRPGHAGTVILVGSVARSKRFHEQLADAVASLRIGYPSDPGAVVGPLVSPPDSQLRFALSSLGEGESWLVEPRQLDDTGRLWSPGIRAGVKPGSYQHVTEFFGPVLSVMHTLTLDEAIRLQNSTQYGLTAGIHSLDRTEIAEWLRRVEAGNLYVNRDILGNTPQRQPFGGWLRSMVGTATKFGGPNSLLSLGTWRPNHGEQSQTLHLRGIDEQATALIESAAPFMDYETFDRLRRASLSDQIAFNEEFGEVSDVSNLGFERNLMRYIPVQATIRAAEDATLADLIRIVVAARIVRSKPLITSGIEVPDAVLAELQAQNLTVRRETDAEFAERARAGGIETLRVRLVGGKRREFCDALEGDPDISIWSDEVTPAGRIEALPFLREQAISITAHRGGHPDPRMQQLFPYEQTFDPDAPITQGPTKSRG